MKIFNDKFQKGINHKTESGPELGRKLDMKKIKKNDTIKSLIRQDDLKTHRASTSQLDPLMPRNAIKNSNMRADKSPNREWSFNGRIKTARANQCS